MEHHRDIFRYARSFTHNDADAEDLAQTAVVRALQRGTDRVATPSGRRRTCKRIVRNLATDQARARARVSVEPRAEVPDARRRADVEPDDDRARDRRDVGPSAQVAFAGLDAADREVLRLRYLDELDVPSRRRRGCTPPSTRARQRVYRAMQALRAALKPPRRRHRDEDGPRPTPELALASKTSTSRRSLTPKRENGWAASAGEEGAGAHLHRRVTQACERTGLDLADPLPAQVDQLADLVGGAGLATVEPEAQREDVALTLVEHRQQLLDLGREHGPGRRLERRLGATVLDEVAELRLAVFADRASRATPARRGAG